MAGGKSSKVAKRAPKKVDAREAMRVIREQQQRQINLCRGEIQSALEKYNCQLSAEVLLRQGQIIPNITIIPKQQG